MNHLKTDQDRIHGILEVLMAYARFEFDSSVKNSDKGDEIDAIGLGVNMLGEELKSSVMTVMERENMLREIHHRVKNNLQIVSSLLNLQIEKESDEKVRHYARESQSRIRAIALIHEMLYKSPDFKYSNFFEYVSRLTENLKSTYSLPGQKIQININVPGDIFFSIDQLIPLGLIINESVSNSLKYAFPDNLGTITVFAGMQDEKYHIRISDNGRGLGDGFDLNENSHLGMKLIWMLAEQASMQVKMENGNGLHYTLNFADSKEYSSLVE